MNSFSTVVKTELESKQKNWTINAALCAQLVCSNSKLSLIDRGFWWLKSRVKLAAELVSQVALLSHS